MAPPSARLQTSYLVFWALPSLIIPCANVISLGLESLLMRLGQVGSWEAMVKLFKNALYQVLDNSRRKSRLLKFERLLQMLFALLMTGH